MIAIGAIGLCAIVVVVALRTMPRGARPKLYLALSIAPLLLTMVAPLPFALLTQDRADWAGRTIAVLTVVGLALSVTLFTIGAVLTVRAALAGDRRAAVLLARETVLAGVPAGIVGLYAALRFFL